MITVSGIGTVLAKAAFTSGPRLRLYEDLTGTLRDGTSLEEALGKLETGSAGLSRVARDWRLGLLRGASLSQSMKGWVPELDRGIVAAGECEGDALSGLINAKFLADGQKRIRSALLSEVAPPVLGALVLSLMMVLLLAR